MCVGSGVLGVNMAENGLLSLLRLRVWSCSSPFSRNLQLYFCWIFRPSSRLRNDIFFKMGWNFLFSICFF